MFQEVKKRVQENFSKMSQGGLFYVTIDRETIWNLYLDGFPEDERQSHNCNCCKSFIRQFGGIVAIVDNKMVSIWDDIDVEGYSNATGLLSEYIHSLPITDVFINEYVKCGTNKNLDTNRQVWWEHFYIELPRAFVNTSGSIDSIKGEKRSDKDVLARALKEIPVSVTESVLELIEQNSLYKGPEYESNLKLFKSIQEQYQSAVNKDLFVWPTINYVSQAVCRIRSSSIGTLLVNLSEGMDLEVAVSKFEQMVAPTNYKRTTALVTPRMVEQAKEKLTEMGLIDSLDRRFANEADLNAENVLYVDKSSVITDVFKEVSKEAVFNPRNFNKSEEISINDFIEKIIPGSKEIEVLVENRHMTNMVSLLTAEHKETKSLFKWDNPFSWSYTGGITDSIKERVKAAGGNIEGVLRVSLSWFNFDDLDLHVLEPNGNRIYYGDKVSSSSGNLDVDMNANGARSRNAVENIAWTNSHRMQEGKYTVLVNNYMRREMIDVGFDIQIEYDGQVFDFNSRKSPSNGNTEEVAVFHYSKEKGIVFETFIDSTVFSKEKWGLKTNMFHKVKNIMLSPNHWKQPIGNKHFLFLLENCINDEEPRPFFNEFLKDEFTENRKVFEVLGSKVKVPKSENQLSGIGFSQTISNHVIVRVKGQLTKTFKIII